MTVTVHVVTPCFNAAETIDRTIHSVLSQAGDFRIRYHVQDGGSSDGTLERLDWWKARLARGDWRRQCQGVRFTYASAPDRGMYDALVQGFAELGADANAFMTWINADDILMPGALALAGAMERQFTPAELSWFGGAVCILRGDMTTLVPTPPFPREALRLGLCDGVHWDSLGQAGIFFRKWLWNGIDPATLTGGDAHAVSWGLWRQMAAKASFVQSPTALAATGEGAGQAEEGARQAIAALVPEAVRRSAFETLCATGPLVCRILKPAEGTSFDILEEPVEDLLRQRYEQVTGQAAPWGGRVVSPGRKLSAGKQIDHAPVDPFAEDFPPITPLVKRAPGLMALDTDWQFPAITEQHALHRLMALSSQLDGAGAVYVAYPWATLIDKLNSRAKDRDLHLDRFEQFCALLPAGTERVTVCQHIHGHKYTHLFRQAGIGTVFWSHTTLEDVADPPQGAEAVRFVPFPLYPVQVPSALPEAGPEADGQPRPHLFSFIGARANQHYLTEARNWILDLLKDDPRGQIIGRDSWHYQKVVYDLQVRGKAEGAGAEGLVDVSASDQFRRSLLDSTFSLCPAGSGPNSIRLWESLGAGSIPVILADSWAPPGDRRLWDLAAVFCAETPEAIRALPDRLAAIAADPAGLARMRHAMRQIWLLYGPQNFVNDVQEFLLDRAGSRAVSAGALSAAGLPAPPVAVPVSDDAARHLLLAWSSRLLLDPRATLARIEAAPGLMQAVEAACRLAAGTGLPEHFHAVLDHARKQGPAPVALAAPSPARGAVPRVGLLGRHSHRTPLSYAAIRRMVGDRLAWADDPAGADLLVTGFNVDWRENAETLVPLLARQHPPQLAVISEEPLWDITWSGPFTGRDARIEAGGTEIRYTFLGHETSEIYRFDRLPYFVLTEDHYAVRYASLMARFAGMVPAELLARWQSAPLAAAFFAERRNGEAHAGGFPDRDVMRLSGYRSRVAELSQGPGVMCAGKGWGAPVKRQDLPDWHLDKLAHLDGRVRMATAYENVHQRDYISEKIFDAFAVGGVPVYWAGPAHRIFELVAPGAMLNTADLAPEAAARRIAQFTPDAAFAESWLDSCAHLARLFGDAGLIAAERRRVADAVVHEVLGLV